MGVFFSAVQVGINVETDALRVKLRQCAYVLTNRSGCEQGLRECWNVGEIVGLLSCPDCILGKEFCGVRLVVKVLCFKYWRETVRLCL